jgi:hypothetical protein
MHISAHISANLQEMRFIFATELRFSEVENRAGRMGRRMMRKSIFIF